MKRKDKVKLIIWIVVVILCIFSLLQGQYTKIQCKTVCEERGYEDYQRWLSGGLDIKDSCTCSTGNQSITLVLNGE